MRGAFHPDAGIADGVAAKVKRELEKFGLLGEPLGVDLIELPILFAMHKAGIDVVDGQQIFLNARSIKSKDEIALLTQACSMVDVAYEDLYESSPQVKENEVGLGKDAVRLRQ